jgi:hypothetical protein
MHSTARQYDDTTWKGLQDDETGSQFGAEGTSEMLNARDPQLLAGSGTYNALAPLYPLDNFQHHPSTIPWTDGQSLQVGEHLQPLDTQLPGLSLEDQSVLQPCMNDHPTARQRGQILGEVPEFQTVFDMKTAGGQVYHTNPCIHHDTETSTHGYDHRSINFSTPAPSGAVSQVASIMGNSGCLYGPVPQVWPTPQHWQSVSDPSFFCDPSQQLDLSGFIADPFQGSLGYYPTQLQDYSDVAMSFGSSSRYVQGSWPGTFDQTYQNDFVGLPPYQDTGKWTFRQTLVRSLLY